MSHNSPGILSIRLGYYHSFPPAEGRSRIGILTYIAEAAIVLCSLFLKNGCALFAEPWWGRTGQSLGSTKNT
jgi:hypothetical protein